VLSEWLLIDLALFVAGFAAWGLSSLSAGGGSVLVVAAVAWLLRGHAIAPLVAVASLIASPARMIMFWSQIDWRVVRWYLPGAIAGAMTGSWLFTRIDGRLIQVGIGLFLVSAAWQYRLGAVARSFRMTLPGFIAVSFASGTTSAIVGASGLLANPFYLNYGLTKEPLLATRAVNSAAIQIVKITTYLLLGVIDRDLARHGLATGAGAVLAIAVTKPWLNRVNPLLFRRFAVAAMVVGGTLVLWEQRGWLVARLG
jgi:uncharacterized protein